MESSAKLQVVRRSLMKKQGTKALSQTSVMNSHGTTALLTCGSFEAFKKIVKNLFFQKNSWVKTQNKPLVLVHGKIQDVYVNFYDLQRLSSLEQESLGTLQRIKKPSVVFCAKLQNKNLLFLKKFLYVIMNVTKIWVVQYHHTFLPAQSLLEIFASNSSDHCCLTGLGIYKMLSIFWHS